MPQEKCGGKVDSGLDTKESFLQRKELPQKEGNFRIQPYTVYLNINRTARNGNIVMYVLNPSVHPVSTDFLDSAVDIYF